MSDNDNNNNNNNDNIMSNKKRKIDQDNNRKNSATMKNSVRTKNKMNSLKKVITKSAIFTSSITCASSFTSPYFSSSSTLRPSSSIKKISATAQSSSSSSNSIDHNVNEASDKRTNSFNAVWSHDITVPIHTLVLGTHPSIESLSKQQCFGHTMNAFWWIAGDCLKFRRDDCVSKSTNKPYKFAEHLRYDDKHIITYEEQIDVFTSKGFALWDIVQSCEREGSLDSKIKKEIPNNIRAFCDVHGTIRRIVIANGQGGCRFFLKHFRSWWEDRDDNDGQFLLMPGQNDGSLRAFSKYKDRTNGKIQVISALAVSPAAAKFGYLEKREFWEKHCYQPGLEDYNQMNNGDGLDEDSSSPCVVK